MKRYAGGRKWGLVPDTVSCRGPGKSPSPSPHPVSDLIISPRPMFCLPRVCMEVVMVVGPGGHMSQCQGSECEECKPAAGRLGVSWSGEARGPPADGGSFQSSGDPAGHNRRGLGGVPVTECFIPAIRSLVTYNIPASLCLLGEFTGETYTRVTCRSSAETATFSESGLLL